MSQSFISSAYREGGTYSGMGEALSIYLGANTEDGLINQSSISSAYREEGTNSGVGGALSIYDLNIYLSRG